MIQAQTQTADYWGSQFSLEESDIEQIYNHLLEVERPQTTEQITKMVMLHRVEEEKRQIQRLMQGRTTYQPQHIYQVGAELVFPMLNFAQGTVSAVRKGYNPEDGNFDVIAVKIKDKIREFAASYTVPHELSIGETVNASQVLDIDLDLMLAEYSVAVAEKVEAALEEQPDFVRLGWVWFAKSLLLDINMGHLHLSEAVLEINEGGPLSPEEIAPHLDLDSSIEPSVQHFSLNYALARDERFDEVGPSGKVAWFLRRMEPDGVQETPGRLKYSPIPYDQALLSPQLLLLEQELDDEWSLLPESNISQPAVLALTFPHRWAGTIPLSSRLRPLFPKSNRPRQRIVFVDEVTNEEIVGWVVQDQRYVFGLKAWYDENRIPVGGFLHFAPSTEPGVIMLGFDRRRAQREWVRLASVADNRMQFDLEKRSIGCGYDDLMIVGTDVVAAIDALWRRAETQRRSIASLLSEVIPPLAAPTPQKAVHAKTIYSALNLLKRVPPGPIFAELVRNPAFLAVGDLYWQFDTSRWQND